MQSHSTGARVLAALAAFNLKNDGENKYRCNSPIRPGANSHAFTLKIEPDGEHGAYHDFVTEDSGSLYDLARHLGIDTTRRDVQDTKRQYTSLEEYAQAHGIPPDILSKIGWAYETYRDRPALKFQTSNGPRWRFLDGQKPYYISEQGYHQCWYRLRTACKLAVERDKHLVLCNGEISSIAGQYHGIPATALTSGGEKAIPEPLLKELTELWEGEIVVAFDCDVKGQASAPKVAAQLRAAGYTVRAIDLGLGNAGDLADFCMLFDDPANLIYTLPDLVAPLPRASPSGNGGYAPGAPGSINNTDLGNARRLVARHGPDLHYSHIWAKWLIWDGQRWLIDDTGAIQRYGKDTVQNIYSEAGDTPDDRLRQSLAKHALSSESSGHISSMIGLAQSEPGVPAQTTAFDTDDWLLNVANGTIDLRTGELGPHSRDHLITKLIPVEYDPAATCPTWHSFLDRVMNSNQRLITFIRRAIGYSLTGDTSEQCLFFLYGTGANGKSTFLETTRALLGDYGQQTPTESLMTKDHKEINNDIARLRGARFVAATEVEEGQRLAEVLIKQLTGGDTLVARFLHAEFFEFRPSFKIWLAGNHKPAIRGTDYAIWRRLMLIPFTQTIPPQERDPKLGRKLRMELPGILAWAIEGCQTWQQIGLNPPEEVSRATEGYRIEMDTLALFLEEACLTGPTMKAWASELYKAYTSWCQDNGEFAASQKRLGQRLTERGFVRERMTPGYRWTGVGLLQKADPELPDS